MKSYSIALIPGDGIGVDVIDASWLVLGAAARRFDFELASRTFPWSCEYYLEHGVMMPADGIEQLRAFDAIFLGAVGWPARVPDAVSLHGLLLPIRKSFDLYVNARPHRLLTGVEGPLRSNGFDILCIRENTEGEYSGAGGRVHQGTANEVAVETSIFTRNGVERILRYGFEAARTRSGKITDALAAEYPDVNVSRYHVDAVAARFVTHPETLDVVVASNLFGDILTDLGAAIQGGLGFAASANINPAGGVPSMFEPVHGSAPDIAGKGIANPLATIWAGALMLEHLGEQQAASALIAAMENVTAQRTALTPDMGGTSSTMEVADAVINAL